MHLARLLPCALAAACLVRPPTQDDPGGKDKSGSGGPPTACLNPSWSAPHTVPGADPVLAVRRVKGAGPVGRFEMRPLVLDGDGKGAIVVESDGRLQVFDEKGAPVALPRKYDDADLPLTLLVTAARAGGGAIVATPVGVATGGACAAASQNIEVSALPGQNDLAGQPTPGASGLQFVQLFREDERIAVWVDPALSPDRVGLTGDVYVVAHQTPEAWDADNTLRDVSGGTEELTVGASPEGRVIAWAPPTKGGPGAPRAFDVVIDWGQDGKLDPGDLIDGFGEAAGLWVARDLSLPGPYTPQMARTSGGAWLDEEIWWPTDLPAALQPAPLIVLSHGNGHDYRWYGFIGAHLASYGFVVMSHSNNTEPGILAASRTTLINLDWLLGQRNSVLNGALSGLIDPTRVGLLGHSRGGEGVVRAFQRVNGGAEPYTGTNFSAANLLALASIAPTVFDGIRKASPGDRPYLLLVGGADGDVTGGADCPLCQSQRIASVGLGDVMIANFHGASHNVFHDGVGSFDDGVGPKQLSRDQVHPSELVYLLSFFSWKILGDASYREVFTRNPAAWRPAGITADSTIALSFHDAYDGGSWWVDDFQTAESVNESSSGGTVETVGVSAQEGSLDDRDALFGWNGNDAFNGMTLVSGDGWERGAALSWSGESSYTERLASPLDVTAYRTVGLRVAQATRSPETVVLAGPLAFTVELEDAEGNVSAHNIADYGAITDAYPRPGLGGGTGWANEWVSVILPLRDFVGTGSELDLTRITAVRLRFGAGEGSPTGNIGIDDLHFAP